MERRFESRMEEMVAQAQVSPAILRGMLQRLERFVEPFAALLTEPEQRRHVSEYVGGLLSKLEKKTSESIAYMHNQDRQGLQKFVGIAPWDHGPLLDLLSQQVAAELGEPDGVIVFDPSGFPKKGTKSVGVARQWCGRLGKVENCQVGIYMAYVSRKEHALVDVRLYLPEEWTKDRERCEAAGVPPKTRFRTRHTLALEMLDKRRSVLPHAWVAGDDEMGRSSAFRGKLRERGERYLLAVPSNTLVRDLDAQPPEYSGRGRHPKTPFVRVERLCQLVPKEAWTKIEVRDGEKGPIVVEAVKFRVQARTDKGKTKADEVLFVTRESKADGTHKHDYSLSSADPETSLDEFARVSNAEHRVEECFKRGKSETGLGDYQVRNWIPWHHHQVLSLIAAWFLNQETRRGKNTDTRTHSPEGPAVYRHPLGNTPRMQFSFPADRHRDSVDGAQRRSSTLSLSFT